MTIQQIYSKLQAQTGERLYLSRKERDFYIDSLDGQAKKLQILRSKGRLVHPFYRGKRIYLEK